MWTCASAPSGSGIINVIDLIMLGHFLWVNVWLKFLIPGAESCFLTAWVTFWFTDAAFKILNPKTVSRFFRLNSNNALIQFLLEVIWSPIALRIIESFKRVVISGKWKGENCCLLFKGTPEIREHYIDSKKDVDRHLKSACEQFIQQQTKQFIEQLEEFMTKVQTWCMFINLSEILVGPGD